LEAEYHIPVLLNKVIEIFKSTEFRNPVFFDGTLGGGSYTEAILSEIPDSTVIAVDKDINAISFSKNRLKKFGSRVKFFNSSFAEIRSLVKQAGFDSLSGIVLDLGLSSYQLEAEDGFSFMKDTPIDMRADKRKELTAEKVLNENSPEDLEEMFLKYGEIYNPAEFVRNIISARRNKPISTTNDLLKIIESSFNIKGRARIKLIAKIFQALRIFINNEIEDLQNLLNTSLDILNHGGIIIVVSYHSLEDRSVKNFFKDNSREQKKSKYSRGEANPKPVLQLLTKKPVIPVEQEIRHNPRSRSAKLRAAMRI
jgi:16S rRNA (cytosine1402-N4)-methyltransferase